MKAYVKLFFNLFHIMKPTIIHPKNSMNTHIYHYNPLIDKYRYKSSNRKKYKKQKFYSSLNVQDHHIIPKQWKNHALIREICYDINSSNNLIIMPTRKGMKYLNLSPDLRIHDCGHAIYNIYVKKTLDSIYANDSLDEKKYYFWHFLKFLKKNVDNKNYNIPWN